MQFVLVIYHGDFPLPGSEGWQALPDAEKTRIYKEYADVNRTSGITTQLPPIAPHQATTVQVQDGRVAVKDGPHLEESIAGAFAVEANDLDAAIALAARIPQARLGGAVEVRAVEKYF
jgi:hypothetical protein